MPDPPEINQLTLLSSNVLRILTGANHVYHITDAGVDIHARASLTRTGYATMSGITCAALNNAGLWLGTANAGLYRLPLAATSGDVTAQLAVALSTTTTPALASDAINDVDGYGAALLVAHAAGLDYLPDSETVYRCAVDGGAQLCACGPTHIAFSTPYRISEMSIPEGDFAAPGWESSLGRVSLSDDFHSDSASSSARPDPALWIPGVGDNGAELRIAQNALQVPQFTYTSFTRAYNRSNFRFTGDFSVELAFEDFTGFQEPFYPGVIGSGDRKGISLYIDNNTSASPTGYEIVAGFYIDTNASPIVGTDTPVWWYRWGKQGTWSSWGWRSRSGTSGRIRFTRVGVVNTVDIMDGDTGVWRLAEWVHTAERANALYVYTAARLWKTALTGRITALRLLSGEPDRLPPLVTPRALRYDADGRLAISTAEHLHLLDQRPSPSSIPGLVAEYSGAGLDLDTWTITPDRGDTSLVATFTGLTNVAAGRLGQAIELFGNGGISVPRACLPGPEFTFCAWVSTFGVNADKDEGAYLLRCNSLDKRWTTIAFKYGDSSRVGSPIYYDHLRVRLYNANARTALQYWPASGKYVGGWALVAVTYAGGEYNVRSGVWYNGQQLSVSGTAQTDFQGASTDILIGCDALVNGTNYLIGKLEKIRFYNRALTPLEIQALYNEPAPDEDPVTARLPLHLPAANDIVFNGGSFARLSASQYESIHFSDSFETLTEYGGNVAGLDQQYYHALVDDVWFALPASAIVVWLPVADLTLLAAPLTPPAVTLEMPAALLSFNAPEPVARTYLLHRPHQRIWRLTLDGIELPMSSFQLRLRESDNSYFSAVVPHAPAYADIVTAHPTGQLRIYQGYLYADGLEDLVLIAQATLQTISDSRGPNSQSLTLTGYGKAPAPGPAVETDSVSFTGVSGGVTRWRCAPTPQLAPGGILIDRATGDQIRAALITWYVSISGNSPNAQMEVSTDGNW